MTERRGPGSAGPAGLAGLLPALQRLSPAERRRLVWIVAAGLLGVALLMAAQFLDGAGVKPGAGTTTDTPPPGAVLSGAPLPDAYADLAQLEAALSARLAEVLSRVEGAGRVHAWVTVVAGAERVFARESDETRRLSREVDAQGGQREVEETTSRSQLATAAAGGGDPPVISVRAGQIRGVLVVAEGAGDPLVRMRLQRAVEAVLGVPAHRVQVLSGKDDG